MANIILFRKLTKYFNLFSLFIVEMDKKLAEPTVEKTDGQTDGHTDEETKILLSDSEDDNNIQRRKLTTAKPKREKNKDAEPVKPKILDYDEVMRLIKENQVLPDEKDIIDEPIPPELLDKKKRKPREKKPLSDKQKEVLEKARLKRAENVRLERERKQKLQDCYDKQYQNKLVRKAIEIKKKQLKKEKQIDDVPDEIPERKEVKIPKPFEKKTPPPPPEMQIKFY